MNDEQIKLLMALWKASYAHGRTDIDSRSWRAMQAKTRLARGKCINAGIDRDLVMKTDSLAFDAGCDAAIAEFRALRAA